MKKACFTRRAEMAAAAQHDMAQQHSKPPQHGVAYDGMSQHAGMEQHGVALNDGMLEHAGMEQHDGMLPQPGMLEHDDMPLQHDGMPSEHGSMPLEHDMAQDDSMPQHSMAGVSLEGGLDNGAFPQGAVQGQETVVNGVLSGGALEGGRPVGIDSEMAAEAMIEGCDSGHEMGPLGMVDGEGVVVEGLQPGSELEVE